VLDAHRIAKEAGLHHVYAGNVHHEAAQSSYCTGCGQKVIGRDWYKLTAWHLDDTGHCTGCGTKLAGVIDGPPGTWGRKRQPIHIGA
jgi:pyruvate formate lyase activating enzyme